MRNLQRRSIAHHAIVRFEQPFDQAVLRLLQVEDLARQGLELDEGILTGRGNVGQGGRNYGRFGKTLGHGCNRTGRSRRIDGMG